MKYRYYFSIFYSPRSTTCPPHLSIIIPKIPYVQWLLNGVIGRSTDDWFIKQIEQVTKGEVEHLRTGDDDLHEAVIHPDRTLIYHQDDEKLSMETSELHALANTLLQAKKDIENAYNAGSDWHGLPTKIPAQEEDLPSFESDRYFDPQTGKAGYFKDTVEGKKWAEKMSNKEADSFS